jgi:hypothetical protein
MKPMIGMDLPALPDGIDPDRARELQRAITVRGRWRSPLFSWLSQIAGRSYPAINLEISWRDRDWELHSQALDEYTAAVGEDADSSAVRLRSTIERKLLATLLSEAQTVDVPPLPKRSKRVVWLCGTEVIRSLKKSKIPRAWRIVGEREIGVRVFDANPIAFDFWPRAMKGAGSIMAMWEPQFEERLRSSVLSFDPGEVMLRHLTPDIFRIVNDGELYYKTALTLQDTGECAKLWAI